MASFIMRLAEHNSGGRQPMEWVSGEGSFKDTSTVLS